MEFEFVQKRVLAENIWLVRFLNNSIDNIRENYDIDEIVKQIQNKIDPKLKRTIILAESNSYGKPAYCGKKQICDNLLTKDLVLDIVFKDANLEEL